VEDAKSSRAHEALELLDLEKSEEVPAVFRNPMGFHP
jgi:hypothetical protein